MPGRSPIDLLIYEAGRRPEVKMLMDRVMVLTDAEIDMARVPLPWYRKALRQYRDMQLKTRNHMVSVGNTMEAMKPFIRDGYVKDVTGQVYTYHGDTKFIDFGKSAIQMNPGQRVFFPDTGGVWLDSVFSQAIDPNLGRNVSHPAKTTRMGYLEYQSNRRAGLASSATEAINVDANDSRVPSALASLGVRFG